MDGTIVNTEPYWIDVEFELVESRGGNWSHADGLAMVGNELNRTAQMIRERSGIPGEDAEMVEFLVAGVARIVRERGVEWRPGARELLAQLRAAQVPCALVTMSYAALADATVAKLPADSFQAVVTGEQVRNGKPHPEPYLLAAERLGVPISQCVVIEDSQTGLQSAEAAGAKTVGVKMLVPIDKKPGRTRLASLTQIELDDLRRINAGEVLDLLGD